MFLAQFFLSLSWLVVKTSNLTCKHVRRLPQDLANQIRWSKAYKDACAQSGRSPAEGKFLCPRIGEWFSGLPRNWTCPVRGAVDPSSFDAAFPDARKAPCSVLWNGNSNVSCCQKGTIITEIRSPASCQ